MAAQTLTTIQKTALIVSLISLVVWGIPMLLFPGFLWTVIGGATDAVSPVYSRYGGAFFLGIAFSTYMALRKSALIGTLFDLLVIGAGLTFIALAADFFAGNSPFAVWFIWAAIIDGVAVSGLSFVSRPK